MLRIRIHFHEWPSKYNHEINNSHQIIWLLKNLDVGLFRDKFQALFKASKKTNASSNNPLSNDIITETLGVMLDIESDVFRKLNQRDQQGSKGYSPSVITKSVIVADQEMSRAIFRRSFRCWSEIPNDKQSFVAITSEWQCTIKQWRY